MCRYGTVSTASSYLSASDKRVHFGLGKETEIVIDANLYEALGKSPRAA